MTGSTSADALDELLRLLDYPRRRNQPWVVGVLADLSGTLSESLPSLFDRRFVEISTANFDRVLSAARPRIEAFIDVPEGARVRVELSFERLADFEPSSVVERSDVLQQLFARWQDEMAVTAAGQTGTPLARELHTQLSGWCSQLLHASAYHDLEASWRGLRYLVDTIDPDKAVIRVLNVSKRELAQNLRRYGRLRFDNSPLFRKVYEEAYGQFGALPYSLLVADMGFSLETDDCLLLLHLLPISAASYAPLLTAAAPQLFGGADFKAVADLSALRQRVRQPQYAKWNSVTQDEDARFIGVCLPRVLIRPPYVAQRTRSRVFQLDEQDAGNRGGVWMNPAYAVASALVNGTAADAVHGLARRVLRAEDSVKAPVEAVFDSELCQELSDIGLIPIAPVIPVGERLRIMSFSSLAAPRSTSPVQENAAGAPTEDFNIILRQSRATQRLHAMLRDGVTTACLRQEAYRAWRARFDHQLDGDSRPMRFVLDATRFQIVVHDLADEAIQIEAFWGAPEGRKAGSLRVQLT